jgi:hypothetical protein
MIRALRRRGLVSEAAGLVARAAPTALRLTVLHFDVEPHNQASASVARSRGAQPTGRVRRDGLVLQRSRSTCRQAPNWARRLAGTDPRDRRGVPQTIRLRDVADVTGSTELGVAAVGGAGGTRRLCGAGLVDSEALGEDRCRESAGEGEQRAVAAGTAGDAVGRQALAQVLGGDVRPGLAAREQPAVFFTIGNPLVSQGERDRGGAAPAARSRRARP